MTRTRGNARVWRCAKCKGVLVCVRAVVGSPVPIFGVEKVRYRCEHCAHEGWTTRDDAMRYAREKR